MKNTDINSLIDSEVNLILDHRVIELIRMYQIEPRLENREWDYSKDLTTYPCWIFWDHPESNTCIAYCNKGFGPTCPWGLLFISGKYLSMGMDSSWYSELETVIKESHAWSYTD